MPQDNIEQDLDDDDQEGDDKLDNVFLVPDDDDDIVEANNQQETYILRPDDIDDGLDTPLMIVEDEDDDMTDLEQQEAWLQLQNVSTLIIFFCTIKSMHDLASKGYYCSDKYLNDVMLPNVHMCERDCSTK